MNYGKRGTRKQIKAVNSTAKKLKTKALINILKAVLVIVLLISVTGVCVGLGMVKGILDNSPEITPVDVEPSGYLTIVYDSAGEQIQTLVKASSNRKPVTYEQLPQDLIDAFVAIEDSRFWTHNGIDLKGILRAGVIGLTNGFKFTEGASTITQQLLKNTIFEGGAEKGFGAKLERKIQEQYLALELEKEMDKKDILVQYLTTINLGNNTLGVQSASNRYFNKDVSQLTLSECATIAAITQNPSKYNPITHPDKNNERRTKVLNDMCEQGMISEQERDIALNDDVYTRIQEANAEITSTTNYIYSYFVDELIEQVMDDLQTYKGYTETQAHNMLYSGGLRIYTTQDSRIQNIMDDEINNPDNYPKSCTKYSFSGKIIITHADGSTDSYNEQDVKRFRKETYGKSDLIFIEEADLDQCIEDFKASVMKEGDTAKVDIIKTLQPQLSFVVIENDTGYVRAVTGGRGEKQTSLSLNRATNTTRQPGSIFKVLAAFAPAIDIQGDTLASVYYDAPFSVGNKTFSNYWGNSYMGYSNIRQGIVYSMNIVATRCLVETVTPELGYQYLLNFGFTSLVESRVQKDNTVKTDIGAALALGGLTDGVTNLETTAAYAAIANGGVYTKPVFYTKILDHDGNIILENKPITKTVIKPSTAFLLTDAMEETMDPHPYPKTNPGSPSATGTNADVAGMSIAGKTGTTTADNDKWFLGFSPYYTAGVWTGYDENSEIIGSQNYHQKIWSKIMTRIHEGMPDIGFTDPATLDMEAVQICRKSGKLAIGGVCDADPRGSMVYTEYFARGTAPTEVCDKHVEVTICTESGELAGPFCPDETKQKSVYMILPPDAAGDTDDSLYAMPADASTATCHVHTGVPEYSLPDMSSWFGNGDQ